MSAEENKALVLRRLHSGVLRLRSGWLPVLQTAVAACLAWFLAVLILGLERPTFAPIAAVIVVGVGGGAGGDTVGTPAPPIILCPCLGCNKKEDKQTYDNTIDVSV